MACRSRSRASLCVLQQTSCRYGRSFLHVITSGPLKNHEAFLSFCAKWSGVEESLDVIEREARGRWARICEIPHCVRDDTVASSRQGRLRSMKMKEITELSTDELLTKRRDLRQESLHLRLQQQSGQLEQPSRLRLLRRDIARLETVLTQRAKQTAAKE